MDSGLSGQHHPWKQTPCARCSRGLQAPGSCSRSFANGFCLPRSLASPHLASTSLESELQHEVTLKKLTLGIWKTSSVRRSHGRTTNSVKPQRAYRGRSKLIGKVTSSTFCDRKFITALSLPKVTLWGKKKKTPITADISFMFSGAWKIILLSNKTRIRIKGDSAQRCRKTNHNSAFKLFNSKWRGPACLGVVQKAH